MKFTSQTGLLASITKHVGNRQKDVMFNLEVDATHAPFTTKPFTGVFNPFAKRCSIMCNHPARPEVKRMLQRAKATMGEEGKAIMPEKIADQDTIHLQDQQQGEVQAASQCVESSDITDIVPEELFRKYTETDSRPLSPTPTLASLYTRASATRRCVTPDPLITASKAKEKTLLVLDLRRSHSQETLSCFGGSGGGDVPLIRILNVSLTPASSRRSLLLEKRQQCAPQPVKSKETPRSQQGWQQQVKSPPASPGCLTVPEVSDAVVEEYVKRRGRKRKKRRTSSRGSVFRVSTDPETLVAGVDAGVDSKNASARPSLSDDTQHVPHLVHSQLDAMPSFACDSFLDYETLRQLRRALTTDLVEMEFDACRRAALEEALKTLSSTHVACEELQLLQRTLLLPQIDTAFRFSLPQKFTRASVRFELPMDSRDFNNMTPMQYIKDNVFISSTRKLLYLLIFNIHRVQPIVDEINALGDIQEGKTEHYDKEILGTEIITALGALMGKALSQTQAEDFYALMGWSLNETYTLRTFSAICAICERLLAVEFYPNLPDRLEDPCEVIEEIDFESLESKMRGKTMDARLVKLLQALKVA